MTLFCSTGILECSSINECGNFAENEHMEHMGFKNNQNQYLHFPSMHQLVIVKDLYCLTSDLYPPHAEVEDLRPRAIQGH